MSEILLKFALKEDVSVESYSTNF